MQIQQSVAVKSRHIRLAPGTRRYYLSSSLSTFVQAKAEEFDGMALMTVDIVHTSHATVKERCLHYIGKQPVVGGRPRLQVGEFLVTSGEQLGSLRLAFHPYVRSRLQPEGVLIPTADLGRIISIIG